MQTTQQLQKYSQRNHPNIHNCKLVHQLPGLQGLKKRRPSFYTSLFFPSIPTQWVTVVGSIEKHTGSNWSGAERRGRMSTEILQGRVKKKKKGRQVFSGRFPGCIRAEAEAEDQVRISQQILVNSDVSTGKKNLPKQISVSRYGSELGWWSIMKGKVLNTCFIAKGVFNTSSIKQK